MFSKFVDSGYREENLLEAKQKAMDLDRELLLKGNSLEGVSTNTPSRIITFVVNFDPCLRK